MKPKYTLIVAIVVAIPVVLLMINTADSGSPGTSPTIMPPSSTASEQVELRGRSVETKTPLTATPEAEDSLIVPEGSGATLLQTHCAQCHSVKLLEHTRKSRADWEKTLSRMERHSGPLSDAEKLLVLEHLTTSAKP